MITQNAAPVFKVSSLVAAMKHYKEVLGFAEDFRFGSYAGVKLGNVSVHLSEQVGEDEGAYDKPIGGSIVYIFCDEVDGYYADVEKKGATIKYPPKDWPYGMREFMLADLDGNHLAFGCDSKKA